MNCKYTEKQKENVLHAYQCGERIAKIAERTGIPRTTIYAWIRKFEDATPPHKKSVNLKMYRELERKLLHQQRIVEILHASPCVVNAPLDERIHTIDQMISDKYNINILCEALCVSKGTYYNRKLRGKGGNTLAKKKRREIEPVIKEIYDESNQIYGPGKVHAIMKDRGYTCSINVVTSIMHDNNWFSIRGGAKALYEQNKNRREDLIKQRFIVHKPNEVWVSDVTELHYKEKRIYLCVIIDLYARKVIAYRYSYNNNTPLVKKTFTAAYDSREPKNTLIFHSDQGANYTSRTFRTYLLSKGVQQSFSRSGMPYDYSVCESFFSIYKQEEFYRRNYTTESELKKGTHSFMSFYNTKRPHTLLRYSTPDAHEEIYFNKHTGEEHSEIE